uniref:Uncharacterized protein n=1 Tax=Anopheles coluzzii TaxID=1518534 RepID=A0A8W7Q133_ANOCL
MASIPGDNSNICRFCLCQEEKQLMLISRTLNPSLTIEDVRRFTGIQKLPDDANGLAICFECLGSLKKSADFRYACIRNDSTFRQLSAEAAACRKGNPTKPVDHSEHIVSADPLELKFEIIYHEEDSLEPVDEDQLVRSIANEGFCTDGATQGAAEEAYSANYIELGEPTSDANEENDAFESHRIMNYCAGTDSVSTRRTRKPRKRNPPNGEPEDLPSSSVEGKVRKKYDRRKVLCHLCGKTVADISVHLVSHKQEANHQCPHCPTKMTHPSNLLRHVESVHMKKIIKTCALCGEGFKHMSVYTGHMLTKHNIGKTYKCELCSQVFKYPGNLREHRKRKHSTGSECVCPICGMMFNDRGVLKRHAAVHSTDTPYHCKHCPKQFKSGEAKKAHELTHSGVKFDCKFCNKSYRYRTQLCTHVTRTHRIKVEENASGSD